MPKTITYKASVQTIIRMARLNLKVVEVSGHSSQIILENIYKNIAINADPLAMAEAFEDGEILITLDGCRSPITKRLFFDFTLSATYGKSSGDLATFALRYGHLGTALNLLLEEKATWAADKSAIMRGSSRTLADGTTWFHKILILASKLHERYKDRPEKQDELKECLQNLMQVFSDVLDIYPPERKNVFIINLRKHFNESDSSACALAILKAFPPKVSAKDSAKGSEITEHYGLTFSALAERKHLIARSIATDVSAEERETIKAYLKIRFQLSALMLNRLSFEDSIATLTPLHIEALIETLIKLSRDEQINAIKYLLKSLSADQAKKFLEHVFEIINIHYILSYLSEDGTKEISAPDAFRVAQDMIDITTIAMESLGSQLQQLSYIYTALKTKGIDSTAEENLPFLRHMAVYFCTYVPGYAGLNKIEASTDLLPPSEFEYFPQLAEKYAGKLSAFRNHIIQALKKEDVWRIVEFDYYCTYLWQAYLFSMWVEFNHIDCSVFPHSFQMLDYVFETILQKPKTYPRLYAYLTDALLSSDYFSNKKLEYFFKYRFGEHGAVAAKIRILEGVRQGLHKRDGTSEFVKADFEEEPKSLLKIETALTARHNSIYAQLAFANEWAMWADSKEEVAADAKSPAFKFMLAHLLAKTPFAARIKSYAMHQDSEELGDDVLDYLLALVEHPERFAAFNYEFLVDKLVFTKESAQACLLLFLFLYGHNTKTKHYLNLSRFIERLFAIINKQFDHDPLKQADFAALYEEMGKHRFFKSLVQDELCRIIYKRFHSPSVPRSTVVENLALLKSTPPEHRTEAEEAEEAIATLISAAAPELTDSPPSKGKRKRRAKKKASHHPEVANAGAGKTPEEDDEEIEEASIVVTAPAGSTPSCPEVTSAAVSQPAPDREALHPEAPPVHETTALASTATASIAVADVPTLAILQRRLQGRLKLPKEMPVVKQLAALFSEKATLALFGSALFFSNPLDIDLKLTWIDPETSLKDAKAIFQALVESAGFKVIFTRDLIGAVSFTLKGKGDGYELDDHKEIDITLQLADPACRPKPLHHNTHCAVSLDVTSGLIDCDLETAKAIVNGVFQLYHHPIAAPIEAFKAGVHSLTALMRAWYEHQQGKMILSATEQALLAKITKHEGNWTSLRTEDEALASHLQGMITRHFMHYQPTETYRKRTTILFNFLNALKVDIKSSVEQATARAIKNMLMDDLLNYEGTPFFVKTELFLAYCQELNLPMHQAILKESLTSALQNHFSHFSESPDFVAKTALLINFFHRHYFRLIAQIPGQEYPCELLGVNGSVFYFSCPLLITDTARSLFFTPSASLLEANQKAILGHMHAMMASLTSVFAAPPACTASCATLPISPITSGVTHSPYSTGGASLPTFFSLAATPTSRDKAPAAGVSAEARL